MNFFIGILSIDLFYLFMGISSFFESLFVLLILIQIIRINSILIDKNLRRFFYTLLVFVIVTSFSSVISAFFYYLMDIFFEFYWFFAISCVIIFGIFFYTAWYNLEDFFDKNRNSFPDAVAQEAVLAIDNFKKATVLYFLIIPAILGIVLYVRGCLMLGDALKKL